MIAGPVENRSPTGVAPGHGSNLGGDDDQRDGRHRPDARPARHEWDPQ